MSEKLEGIESKVRVNEISRLLEVTCHSHLVEVVRNTRMKLQTLVRAIP